MTPHLSWVQAFDQILVLDATAQITDYLYQDYTIVQPGTWNYADVTLGYKVLSGIGDLTKTAMQRYKESFLEDLQTNVRHIFDLGDFHDPYVVTFKTFEDNVRSLLHTEVSHYGETRGSNAFKQKDSAVLLGAYRPPVSFDKLAQLLFRERYSPYKFAVAHWIQEMYRTRIRQGEPINLLVMGERQAIEHFQKAINTTLWPSVIGADDPEVRERTLQNLKSKTQQQLYTQLIQDRQIDVKAFAQQFTGSNAPKVHRAVRGLCQQYPMFEDHIVIDDQTIRLVDKLAPSQLVG